ncbi:hypothetical protein [Methanobacterium sp. ACI-7]|uniref:hypothetical protein n=1 Tax=unclassified Methanobacterium TaxID=2627676 RepID=UPI0039C1CB40
MKSKKPTNNDTPIQLLDKAYRCKNNELKKLLEEIESKIKSEGNNETLSRAKSVITTKLILEGEK